MTTNRIVLAEYFTTDDVTLLFGVRADWDEPEVVEIKQPLSEIRKYVMANFGVEDGEEKQSTSFEKIQNLDLDEWQLRFAPFIEPILKWAEPGDYLYLVPHDVLHYLPLHTLKVEGGYLIERNPVLYTPSASVLKYCQAKRTGRQRENILVLGDSNPDPKWSLPYARSEALEVASIFGAQPYIGHDARKSLVKGKLEKERDKIDILHFACHGKFHPVQALKSGILMAPEPDEEEKTTEFEIELNGLPISRYLTAEEFFGMEMHADLVTLSACESGVNDIRPGDELFGFMRALIYAGTPSVVMSLWKVADISTELFMVHFYERLKSGDTKVEALQKAQVYLKNLKASEAKSYYENKLLKLTHEKDEDQRIQVMKSIDSVYVRLLDIEERIGHQPGLGYPIFDHPFYWAPFILVGDWK